MVDFELLIGYLFVIDKITNEKTIINLNGTVNCLENSKLTKYENSNNEA